MHWLKRRKFSENFFAIRQKDLNFAGKEDSPLRLPQWRRKEEDKERTLTNNLTHMKKIFAIMLASAMTLTASAWSHKTSQAPEENTSKTEAQLPKVYFIKEINSQNLLKIYEALGRKAEGKVAVKLSTGEPGNDNHLDPNLIKDLVQKVKLSSLT